MDRQLVAVFDGLADLVDVREVDLGIDTLREHVEAQRHEIDVAGTLAVAEQAAFDTVGAGQVMGSPERMRVVLDTLVENAVRYTETGDTIRVHASHHHATLVLGVADSGAGICASRRAWLNAEGGVEGFSPPLEGDSRTQTGLGLGIVRSVAVARGGRLVVEEAREGGAFVAINVPADLEGNGRPLHAAMSDDTFSVLPPAHPTSG